jgi:DNA-binding PadR family transcriptional regulator
VSLDKPDHRNLWSLTVLCLLRIRPMHPYEIQRLIRDYHKDEFLELKRGSLYHAIERLRSAGLIDPIETFREGRRPERTVYRLTELGEREVVEWLRQLLAKPVADSTQFFAALSFLSVLSPQDAWDQLQVRAGLLEAEVAGLNRVLAEIVPKIGRLYLVEIEYRRALREAELAWVKSLMEDLQAGRLAWDPEVLRQAAAKFSASKG